MGKAAWIAAAVCALYAGAAILSGLMGGSVVVGGIGVLIALPLALVFAIVGLAANSLKKG